MIKTFEDFTIDLTPIQREQIVPRIIKYLQANCHGEHRAITSKQFVGRIHQGGFEINDVSLRRCIKFIQFNRMCKWIVATQNGFFFTQDRDVVEKQIQSLIERENAIRIVRESIQKSLIP